MYIMLNAEFLILQKEFEMQEISVEYFIVILSLLTLHFIKFSRENTRKNQ